jgi:4-diphosphocytidyl-2-C-methyl-D-erythritol kinase
MRGRTHGGRVRPRLLVRVPAKVNLVLDVGPRRADGFHAVETVLQAIAVFDELWLEPGEGVSLVGRVAGVDRPEDNLAWRAAELLRGAAGVSAGVRVRLIKRIPVGAGLGGGSADAAAALVGCAALWRLGWARERLAELGARLGSDVPFFLWGGTAWADGRGERVRPLPVLPPWPVVVAFPGVGQSTAEAYAALDRAGGWPRVSAQPLLQWLADHEDLRWRPGDRYALAARLGNAFDAVVPPARPDVAALRDRLLEAGALACLVSGSGSAVWALAPSGAWAQAAARALEASGCPWVRATRLWAGGASLVPAARSRERVGRR